MMRSLMAAAAALLFGAAAQTASAQCCCCSKPKLTGCPLCTPATTPVKAEDPKPAAKPAKEEKLEGTMHCAKCGLKMAGIKKCTNALVVKENGKEVTYLLDDKGSKEEYHEGLCGGGKKEGTKVTGTVTEKDGQKWIKASKVEEKK